MRIMKCMAASAILVASNSALAVPSVSVSLLLDDTFVRLGQSTTARASAQVSSPASASDGIFTYDLNVPISPTSVVTPIAASVAQPNVDSPNSAGTLSSTGLAAAYGTYFFVQNRGISTPQELVSFSVQGATLGTTTLTVTGDTTIGDDFLLQQSSPPTVNYASALATISVRAGDEWKGPGGGSFNTAANWVGSTVPNGAGVIADFLGGITAASTVTLASSSTVGVLRFKNANSYTLAGPQTLTISASTGKAAVIVKQGNHTVSAPVVFNSDADLDIRAGSLSFGGVSVANSRRVSMLRNGNRALYATSLNLNTSGTLDLNDNDLVVSYGTAPNAFAAIQALVFSGFRASPDPSATGIVSTTAQNDSGKEILALLDNQQVQVADWPPGSGHTIAINSVVGKYTYFGDLNLDGQVTGDDYPSIDSNLNTTPPAGIAWLNGDANLDGAVTGDDYAVIDSNLGNGMANPLVVQGAPGVPEPTLTLIAPLAAQLLQRRRRMIIRNNVH